MPLHCAHSLACHGIAGLHFKDALVQGAGLGGAVVLQRGVGLLQPRRRGTLAPHGEGSLVFGRTRVFAHGAFQGGQSLFDLVLCQQAFALLKGFLPGAGTQRKTQAYLERQPQQTSQRRRRRSKLIGVHSRLPILRVCTCMSGR